MLSLALHRRSRSEGNPFMNRLTYVACALAFLAVSHPARAEKRSNPSPTTTARRSGEKLHGARHRSRKLESADVPTRTNGSDVDVRKGSDGRKPEAAKIPVRKAKG
jgi:hypothetical protein